MDGELVEALSLYKKQLAEIAVILTTDPHNQEALQLQQQLQEALEFTAQAYDEAYGQDDDQDAEQKDGGGEYQFNSDENLAIAAAAAAGAEHADPYGTGLADTAAAARAQAARTTKNKRAAQGSPGAGEQEEELEQALVGGFELASRGATSHSQSGASSDTAAAEAGAVEAGAAEEERRCGHLYAGPSGRGQGGRQPGFAAGQLQAGSRGRGGSPSRTGRATSEAASLGGQHGRLAGAGRAALSAASVERTGRNNPRMHPNNKYYREEPDFVALSEAYPELRPFLSMPKLPGGRAVFNYASWEGTRQLTSTLLKADFGIDWWLPEGQLVPTVTNRANYIHWINDLLGLSSPEPDPSGLVEGLDIGCGTNLIYCLLGAAVYGWRMVGVDVTDVALEWAERHIERNPHLQHLLEVRQPAAVVPQTAPAATAGAGSGADGTGASAAEGGGSNAPQASWGAGAGRYEEEDPGGIITPALVDDQETFAFSMCNPPFFESIEEANSNPATACGGTPEEMVYPGGEVAFIMRMMEDSVRLGSRVHWYTTMVGKKTTLKVLRKELHARHVTAIRTTELAQGKTSRWAIAWSFAVDRNLASVPIARPINPELARPLVPKRAITLQLKTHVDPRAVLKHIAGVLETHGAAPPPSIDQGLWRVSAAVPPAAAAACSGGGGGGSSQAGGSAAAAAAGGAAAQGVPHRASGGGGKATRLDTQTAAAGEQPLVGSPPSSKAPAASAVAAAADAAAAGAAATGSGSASPAEQQHKKPRPTSAAPSAEEPGTSVQGGGAAVQDAACPAAARPPVPGPGLSMRITLFQVQRGLYEVCASVPNSAGLPEATRFTAIMQRVQADIEAGLAQ